MPHAEFEFSGHRNNFGPMILLMLLATHDYYLCGMSDTKCHAG